jgi:beta-glucosidase
MAAAARDFLLNRLFFKLIGSPDTLDFIGINYYTRMVVRSQGDLSTRLLGSVCREHTHTGQGPVSKIGWESYPQGLNHVLERFGRLRLPLLVTENGIATDDEDLRTRFIAEHLKVISNAIQSGMDVIGYLYWTLMDSFEWTDGFNAPFGLAGVDSRTQSRTPRPCVEEMRRVLAPRRVIPIVRISKISNA